ncbi:C-Myc-binding -like protein [Echinococcus granulosus]|nr:C-Myc-binding -like protein [Echinococcus granulosus]
MQTEFSSKRKEFRKYLENAGVLDAITNALIKLFELPEKPTNPVRFLMECFDKRPFEEETDLRKKNDELSERVKNLEQIVCELQEKLEISQENTEEPSNIQSSAQESNKLLT